MALRWPYISKNLPNGPGVYVFLDKDKKPLYVGRAVSLRRRVSNYFPASEKLGSPNLVGQQKNQDIRMSEMVSSAKKIKHYKTDNLLEAIILEANLIKKYWPKYNVKDRDDRSFVYIVIPKNGYSRPFMVRQRELEKFPHDAEIFGPYQSLSLIKIGLNIIRKIFPYGTCKPNSGRACFYHQIGLCPGACAGKITPEEYQKNINNIILFLKGDKKRLLTKLKLENPLALQALKHIQDVALISREENGEFPNNKLSRIEGYDISHLTGKETVGSMAVFTNGEIDKKQYRLFKIKKAPKNDDLRGLEEVIIRRFNHSEWPRPDLILIDGGRPQISFISKILNRLNINIPLVGISKFSGDKLVLPPDIKKSSRNLIETMKGVLLATRDEAHRFALKASRRERNILPRS